MNHLTRRSFLSHSAAALALTRTPFANAAPTSPVQTTSTPIPFGNITAGGDLAHRSAQNFTRLQSPIYRPPQLFNGANVHAWPGDFEGRALLALTLVSQATGQQPDYLPALVAEYQTHLNPQGYFGPTLDLHAINEQQLSGHGWYLRALCEYYDWKHDPQTLTQIQTIVRNLALPLRGSYAIYPIDPALRIRTGATGGINGHIAGQQSGWAISSDTGCAFIFLDGLAHAWVVLKTANDPSAPALKSLIDEAIGRFLEADLVAIQAQTHASLTGMRALLRVYNQTADPRLLQAARDRFALYQSVGMTEHYANYNWFGRPETWTEPCAIIDSFMIATQLWQHTGNPAYLEDAHLIWANGVGRGLRGNGGFGTDLCAGYKTPFLKVRSYEAPSCCTMRGGEGHARAIQSLYFTRPASKSPAELIVPFYSDSDAIVDLGHGPINLKQTATYPYPAPVRIEVVSAPGTHTPIALRLFAPQWTAQHRLTLNGKPLATTASAGFLTARLTPRTGDVLLLDFDLRIAPRNTINPKSIAGYYAFQAGPIILGYQSPVTTATASVPSTGRPIPPPDPAEVNIPRDAKLTMTAPGAYRVEGTEILLTRINDLNDSNATPRDPCTRQILFRPV